MNEEEFDKTAKQLNELLKILVVDEKCRWYLAGLFDGIKIGKGWK